MAKDYLKDIRGKLEQLALGAEIDREEEYLRKRAHEFVQSKEKNYLLARSIVIDIQLNIDRWMSFALSLYVYLGIKACGLPVKMDNTYELHDLFLKIDFGKKAELVSKLHVFNEDNIKKFWKINDLRNAFAHGYKADHPYYSYEGKSIFKKEIIDILLKDRDKILNEYMRSPLIKPFVDKGWKEE